MPDAVAPDNTTSTIPPQTDPLLDFYLEQMKKEMAANSEKGDFINGWQPNGYELIAETAYHLAKLNKAMLEVERGHSDSAREQVNEFAADVGNYMAKTIQMFGRIPEAKP